MNSPVLLDGILLYLQGASGTTDSQGEAGGRAFLLPFVFCPLQAISVEPIFLTENEVESPRTSVYALPITWVKTDGEMGF